MHSLLHLTPDATIVLLTAGVLLVYLEFNRPGLILPGALGLALSLLAIARLISLPMGKGAAEACVLAAILLILSIRLRGRLLFGIAASISLLYGFGNIVIPAPASRTHLAVTVVCALLLGAGTSFLTTIAARARQNKGLDLT